MARGYRAKWFEANKSHNGLYRCTRCGRYFKKEDIDIDHIVPQNCGGTDELWNLQPMCKHCNRSKQDNMHGAGFDLAGNMIKNTLQGNKIDNVGNLAGNMIKKKAQKELKKGLKNIFG